MFDGPVDANIGNICNGSVPERFEHEMKKILANRNWLCSKRTAAHGNFMRGKTLLDF